MNASRTICLMLIAAHPLLQLNCGPVSQLTPFLFSGSLRKIVRTQPSLVFAAGSMMMRWLRRHIFTAWINWIYLDRVVFQLEIVDFDISYYVMSSFGKGIVAGRNKLRYMIYRWKIGSADDLSNFSSMETSRRRKTRLWIFNSFSRAWNTHISSVTTLPYSKWLPLVAA